MTPDGDRRDEPQEPAPDLEYDLAHEGEAAGWAAAPSAKQGEQGEQHVYVATRTPEADGDYSYDLAHDVPDR